MDSTSPLKIEMTVCDLHYLAKVGDERHYQVSDIDDAFNCISLTIDQATEIKVKLGMR